MIKKLAIVSILVIIASLSIAGCTSNTSPSPTATPIPTPFTSKVTINGNNATFSSTAGFNITYPKTLKTDSNNSASTPNKIFIFIGANNSSAVTVSTEALSSNDTLGDYVNYTYNGINDYQGYQLISNQSMTLGGKPAYAIVWQATIPVQDANGNTTNTTLKFLQYIVVNNSTGYVVTYKDTPDNYNTNLAQAQQIMNSVRFF